MKEIRFNNLRLVYILIVIFLLPYNASAQTEIFDRIDRGILPEDIDRREAEKLCAVASAEPDSAKAWFAAAEKLIKLEKPYFSPIGKKAMQCLAKGVNLALADIRYRDAMSGAKVSSKTAKTFGPSGELMKIEVLRFDDKGRITSRVEKGPLGENIKNIEYSFGPDGFHRSVTRREGGMRAPETCVVERTFNADGMVSSEIIICDGAARSRTDVSYGVSREAVNIVEDMPLEGNRNEYTILTGGRFASITNRRPDGVDLTLFDEAGRPKSRTFYEPNGVSVIRSHAFIYDRATGLLKETVVIAPGSGKNGSIEYKYDKMNFPAEETFCKVKGETPVYTKVFEYSK